MVFVKVYTSTHTHIFTHTGMQELVSYIPNVTDTFCGLHRLSQSVANADNKKNIVITNLH